MKDVSPQSLESPSQADQDVYWMQQALQQADLAAQANEVPVGAVLVSQGRLLGQGYNQPIGCCDPTAHAEIQALRDAAQRQQNYRLPDATLYVTLEPCTMCFGALVHARILRLVYGANEPKAGVIHSHLHLAEATIYNHRLSVHSGVLRDACAQRLQYFFAQRRRSPAS